MKKLIIAASVTAAGVLAFGGVASATDASVKYTVRCEEALLGTWSIKVTAVNQWDGSTTFTFNDETSGHLVHTLVGKTSYSPPAYITSGDQFTITVTDDHPEHLTNGGTQTFTRPAGCTAPVTTVPSIVTTPAPAPTTAARVCEDGKPPSIPVEDGSLVCPEFGAPPDQGTTTTVPTVVSSSSVAPSRPAVVTTAPRRVALPATGGTASSPILWMGLAASVLGVAAVTAGRRRCQ